MRLFTSLVVSAAVHIIFLGLFLQREELGLARRLPYPVRNLQAKLVSPTLPALPAFAGLPISVNPHTAGDYDGQGSLDALNAESPPSTYIPAKELDERPTVAYLPTFDDLTIPSQAKGTLIVQFWINENGLVDMIEIEQSDIVPEIVARLIAERRNMRFAPGRKKGLPVRSMVRYELQVFSEGKSKAQGN